MSTMMRFAVVQGFFILARSVSYLSVFFISFEEFEVLVISNYLLRTIQCYTVKRKCRVKFLMKIIHF